jgi:hypothetical protein
MRRVCTARERQWSHEAVDHGFPAKPLYACANRAKRHLARASAARLNRLPINPHEPELAGPDGSGSSNLKFQWDALFGLGRVPEISIERHYRR